MKCQEFVFEQTLKDIVCRGLVCLGANMGAVVANRRRNDDIVAALNLTKLGYHIHRGRYSQFQGFGMSL